jgi:hypothetical protein
VDGYVASATDGEGRSRPGAEPPVLKTGDLSTVDQGKYHRLRCRRRLKTDPLRTGEY